MINYLEAFLVLSKNLSFSKTAQLLKTSQPGISRQIKLLEEALGKTLFFRTKKSVILTPEGIELRNKLDPLLSGILSLLQRDQILRPTRMGCLAEIGQNLVFPEIIKLRKMHPHMDFDFTYTGSASIVSKVKSGELAMGIVAEDVNLESIRCFKLLEETPVIVTRLQNKKSPQDFPITPWITYRNGDPYFQLLLRQKKLSYARNKNQEIFRVNSHKSMLEALASFDSFAVVPNHIAENETMKKKIKIVHRLELPTSIYLIYPVLELEHPDLKMTRDFLKKVFNSMPSR